MSVDTEPRAPRANTQSSPTFRQTGFAVPTASAPATNDANAVAVAHHPLSPKMRSSNSSLNAALNAKPTFSKSATLHDDGDADMSEASQPPLPIPGSFGKLEPVAMATHASRSPSDVPTPPDAPSVAPHKASPSPHSAAVRLPSLSSSMLSPRYSTLQGSSISSGPTSITSSNWSPSRSTDPHLYSISAGRKYSYTSFNKPSLSTSFKTSAMRMRGPALEDEEDEEDDSFGKPVSRYGRNSMTADRATAEPGLELDGDEVFSFSSPCFGPKELPDEPCPELHEAIPPSQAATSNPAAILSPSWATASLGKLSLGGNEARGSPSSASARRPSRSAHHHHSNGALSSSADVTAAAMKQRRYSYNKHARPSFASPGPSSYTYSSSIGRDHPYARTPTSSSLTSTHRKESRSRSRSRYGTDDRASRSTAVIDDDETDEEMRMDDDDATEDEADYGYGAYSASYQARLRHSLAHRGDPTLGSTPSSFGANNPSNGSLGLTFQMSPGNPSTLAKGHPLDSSRSPVMSNANVAVSLSRQYSSDRHAIAGGLAPLRHHPYATSPSATTGPLSASMGLAYSPGSNAPLNRPAHRRGSSLGNGLAAPAYTAGILSTSPRFANSAAAMGRSPEDGSTDRLSQSPYGANAGSPYAAAGARGLNATGGYYGPAAQGGAYSQSPRYSQSYGARKESNGYVSTLASHFKKHERSDSMASEATEIGDASNASAASLHKASVSKAGARSTSNTGATGNTDETAQVAAIRDRLGGAASCSAFISKLWHLMINPAQYSKFIRWDEAGTSIILSSEPDVANEFASDVLPRLFKHGNNASFIRQLNLYGFQRIPSSRLLDAAEMKVAAAKRAELGANASSTLNTAVQLYGAHSSFAHPRFLRGREELLPTMKPRSSKKPKKSGAGGGMARSLEADTSLGGADETDEEDFAL
ncbi:hypothetical protein NDA16_004361 [Ustilago loliicola]|nr:hypothetical protein NDA16_004361 [Ustilago loliicola]